MKTGLLDGLGFFDWLGRASWQAAVLAGLILTVQWLFRKRLTPSWRYRLWLLVVIRLVLPCSPASLTSVFNAAPFRPAYPAVRTANRANLAESTTLGAIADQLGRSGSAVPLAPGTGVPPSDSAEDAIAPRLPTYQDTSSLAAPNAVLTPQAAPWRRVMPFLPWVWAAGVLFMVARIAWQNLRFGQRLGREATPVASSVQEQFARCRSLLCVRQSVVLSETSLVRSPALYGFLRARLLLPRGLAERFSADELRYVLLHELAHVKRQDMAMNWLMALLQALHWFNPCVWLAFSRMRLDRELACDALALSCAQDEEAIRYGETIIRLLEGMSRGAAMPGLVGVLESRDQIRERIRMIAGFKRPGRWSGMAVLLLLGLGVVGLTDAKDGLASHTITNGPDRSKGLTTGSSVGVDVRGRVTDDQDRPIQGVTVWAQKLGAAEQNTTTDALGQFAFLGMAEAATEFSVSAMGREPDAMQVKVRGDMGEILFRLPAGTVVRAQVQNAQGEPISGAKVTLGRSQETAWTQEFSRTTDKEGRFEWDGAPKEPMRFDFYADGYEVKRDHVLDPDHNNVVTLRRPRRVQASIVDADTGEPITRVWIRGGRVTSGILPEFHPTAPEFFFPEFNLGLKEDAFTVEMRQEDENAVQAEADGYSRETKMLPADRDGVVAVVVRLKPRSALAGLIVDAEGRPVAEATVTAVRGEPLWQSLTLVKGHLRDPDRRTEFVETDKGGQFLIESPPEVGRLIAACDYGFASLSLAEARASATVSLQPYGRLEGSLKVGGQPVAGQELEILPMDRKLQLEYKTTTDTHGRFTIEKIPSGTLRLYRMIGVAPGMGGSSHETQVTIVSGQTTHVTLGDSGAVVRSRVRLATPLPADRKVITCGELSRPMARCPQRLTHERLRTYFESAEWKEESRKCNRYCIKVEPDGTMMTDSVSPGTYTLRVTATEPGAVPDPTVDPELRDPWPGKALAACEMTVTIPEGASPSTIIDLGELVLKPVSQR